MSIQYIFYYRMFQQEPKQSYEEMESQSNQIFEEQAERQREDAINQYNKVKIKDLFPVNFLSEKETFFNHNTQYCPHFVYKNIVYPEPISLKTQYQALALKILKNAPAYPTNIPYLSEQQMLEQIEQYLDNMGLKDFVEIKLQFECLSRTSITFFKNKVVMKIRTPLSYTKINLEGVLHHEVSTHILRTLNHRENCIRKPSERGKIIEEGLAVINQVLPQQKPVLFKPALRYIAAIYASKCNFSQLYKKLNRFVPDKAECWRQCVRVKRGISNTQERGGYYKDQSYLIGAVQILQNRQKIDFERIYYGKLAPQETKHLDSGVLPPFLGTPQKLKLYKKKLEKIALSNFID